MAAHPDNAGISLAFIQCPAAAQPAALLRAHPPGTGSWPGGALPARMRRPFRAEVLRWMPGYADTAKAAPPATANGHAGSAPPARPQEQARSVRVAGAEPRERTAQPAQSTWPVRPEQITWSYVQWRDIMAGLPRPQAPARFRAMFPDLADWLESPWTGA